MGTHSRSPLTLGAAVLVLCALVAATFDGPRWRDLDPGADRPAASEGQPSTGDSEPATAESEQAPAPAEEDGEPWLPWAPPIDVLLVLTAALVFGVALVVLSRLRLVRRRGQLPRRGAVRAPLVPDDPPLDDLAADLPTVLDDAVRTITEGSPRNAIVAAWVRLEGAVHSERFPRRPEETPGELVERALAAYRLDREAIGRLAALYREARFSTHPITDEHRDDASACLSRLLATLGGRQR